jgi:hypothetical protein
MCSIPSHRGSRHLAVVQPIDLFIIFFGDYFFLCSDTFYCMEFLYIGYNYIVW